jgi:ribonuclease Z
MTPTSEPTTKPIPAITVTLLGTGVPLLNATALAAADRALSGLLVQAGSERMLFDVGQGVYTRLVQSTSTMPTPNIAVDKVFLTHLHSDHIGDLGPLYSVGALYRNNDTGTETGLTFPLRVWGPGGSHNQPVPTSQMMRAFKTAYTTDFSVRELFTDPNDFSINERAVDVEHEAHDIKPGVVYESNGVTVTAFLVNHHPMEPSYGFRVDYLGRSFVYSGDTTPIQSVLDHAKGVDLLVHEVYGYKREDAPEVFDYHTSPEDAAKVFLQTMPTQAVYTHMVMPPGTTPNDLVSRTRAAGYDGPLTPGLDLMVIVVDSEGTVTITAPEGADSLHSAPATSHPIEVHRAKQRQAK